MVGNTFFISLCKMSHHGHDDDTFGEFPKKNFLKGVDDQ